MQRLAKGITNFKTIIDENYYYVDKTGFIKDVHNEAVVLYTRPRRFGKTLNMSMLNYFYNVKHKKYAYLFNELEISKNEEVMQYQNRYPVISITLKEMKQSNFQEQMNDFKEIISGVIGNNTELLTSDKLNELEKGKLYKYYEGEVNLAQLGRALLFISQCLEKHYEEKVVILIDEYDVPLQHAYLLGYYDEMISFLKSVLSATLKDNDALKKGILTGCLRIAKESIFTGMNNFSVYGISEEISASRFGFTPSDVYEILSYYNLLAYEKEVKKWYDGYVFGKQEIYNPWSIVQYVNQATKTSDKHPTSFWANTSGNDIVMKYITQANRKMKEEFETLVNKENIVKKIKPELTYQEMDSIDNIYSFLLFTGYLKICRKVADDTYELLIPNEEVRKVYINQFQEYFEERKSKLMEALENEDTRNINDILDDILKISVSYYDNKESFYHGFMLGFLSDYEILSNEEAGNGRLDLVIKPKKRSGNVIIIECKHANSERELLKECEDAVSQIKEKQYMKDPSYQIYGGVIGYGISFYKKDCYVLKCEL